MALDQAQVVRSKPRRPRLFHGLHGSHLGAFRRETDQTTRQYTSEVNGPEQDDTQHRGGVMTIKRCMSMSSAVSGRGWFCFPQLLVTDRGDEYLLVQSWNDRPSECVSEPGRRGVA
jgi:hypothetical protein